MHKQADKLEKTLLAINNFMLTKKKPNPQQQINTKLDVLNSKVTELYDSMEDSSADSSEEKTEEVKYDI